MCGGCGCRSTRELDARRRHCLAGPPDRSRSRSRPRHPRGPSSTGPSAWEPGPDMLTWRRWGNRTAPRYGESTYYESRQSLLRIGQPHGSCVDFFCCGGTNSGMFIQLYELLNLSRRPLELFSEIDRERRLLFRMKKKRNTVYLFHYGGF